MADSSQKMRVCCAGQAGISGASLRQSKTGKARGATTLLTLPPSAAQVKAGAGDSAGEEREGEKERERERERARERAREMRAGLAGLSGGRGQTLDQHLDSLASFARGRSKTWLRGPAFERPKPPSPTAQSWTTGGCGGHRSSGASTGGSTQTPPRCSSVGWYRAETWPS